MLPLEFWLPLPLLGLAFWVISGLVTDHSLKRSYFALEPYKINADRVQPDNQVLFIKVKIDRDRNMSHVKVKKTTQVYEQQEFELATTEFEQIETQISQKLGLLPEQVARLSRYQIKK